MSSSNPLVGKEQADDDTVDNSVIRSTVNFIKEWLAKQEHMPAFTNENLLYHIAAVSKGDNNKACKRLDAYYTVRTLFPEFFSRRDPATEEIRRSCNCVSLGFLPGLTEDGCRVMLFSLLDMDPTMFDYVGLMRRFYMLLDLYFLNDDFKPGQGVYFLIDARGGSISHMMKLSPSAIKKGVYCTQDIYPIKIKGIIFVYINDVVRMTVNTFLIPLFRPKIRNRFRIFGAHFEKLYVYISREILPIELGGSGPSYQELSERSQEQLISNRTWLLTEGSDRSDETKRSGKSPINKPGCSIM